jgi:hypothetical protein
VQGAYDWSALLPSGDQLSAELKAEIAWVSKGTSAAGARARHEERNWQLVLCSSQPSVRDVDRALPTAHCRAPGGDCIGEQSHTRSWGPHDGLRLDNRCLASGRRQKYGYLL